MDITVLDSNTVYWSACADSGGTQCYIWALPVAGGTPTPVYTLSGGGNPSLALASPNLYVASAGLREVLSLPVYSGATLVVDASGLLFDGVAARGVSAAWYAGATTSGASDGVVKAMTIGASPIVVATGQNPAAIAVDDAHVYWSNWYASPSFDSIVRAPVGGGQSAVLVAPASTFDIAVDTNYVYWLGSTMSVSGVFRTPK
jgi:hypothetical protein